VTLRPEYSLGHSQFNAFLFALVGEEKSGLQLTVLSALARLGLDPWEEAERLSTLSEEAATSALTARLAGLPNGSWKAADSRSTAVHLVSYLPKRSSSQRSSQGRSLEAPQSSSGVWSLLAWVALAATIAASFWQQDG
jgi:hypothetical protein